MGFGHIWREVTIANFDSSDVRVSVNDLAKDVVGWQVVAVPCPLPVLNILPEMRRDSGQNGQLFPNQPGRLMRANERDQEKVKKEPANTSPIRKGNHEMADSRHPYDRAPPQCKQEKGQKMGRSKSFQSQLVASESGRLRSKNE